jgi:hypothetical protein
METDILENPRDIQKKRSAETKARAFSVSHPATREIKSLREKAAAVAQKADEFEAEQVNAVLAVESLLARRAEIIEGIAAIEKIVDDLKNLDNYRRDALNFCIKASLSNEQIEKSRFLIAADMVARLNAIAPAVPAFLSEKQAAAAELADEIQVFVEKHKINLSEMRDQFQASAKRENGAGRFSRLSAGFAGLIDN